MLNLLNQAMTWISAFINQGFTTLLNFFLDMFPNADGTIAWWVTSGVKSYFYQPATTLNLFAFIDPTLLTATMTVIVTLLPISIAIRFGRSLISLVHQILDSIPVIG